MCWCVSCRVLPQESRAPGALLRQVCALWAQSHEHCSSAQQTALDSIWPCISTHLRNSCSMPGSQGMGAQTKEGPSADFSSVVQRASRSASRAARRRASAWSSCTEPERQKTHDTLCADLWQPAMPAFKIRAQKCLCRGQPIHTGMLEAQHYRRHLQATLSFKSYAGSDAQVVRKWHSWERRTEAGLKGAGHS